MSSIALLCFSISISLIQLSCSKSEVQASPNNPNTPNSIDSLAQLNKIVYSKEIATGGCELWTANYDGTSQTQIPITLPANFLIESNDNANAVRLSPDGQRVFFVGFYTTDPPGTRSSIYSCDITGTNLTLVIQGSNQLIRLGGAY